MHDFSEFEADEINDAEMAKHKFCREHISQLKTEIAKLTAERDTAVGVVEILKIHKAQLQAERDNYKARNLAHHNLLDDAQEEMEIIKNDLDKARSVLEDISKDAWSGDKDRMNVIGRAADKAIEEINAVKCSFCGKRAVEKSPGHWHCDDCGTERKS